MRALLLPSILSCLVGACVVEESNVTLRCDSENPCPNGQTCGAEGVCVAPDDMGMMVSEDQAGQLDQHTPDLLAPAGCAGAGAKQVGQAVACPGAFAEGQAASRCDTAMGYHICRAAELSKIDVGACDQLSGFYIVEVSGYFLMIASRDSPTCGTSAAGSPVWFGCGGLSSALVHEHPATQCSGLDRSVDCSQTSGAWICKAIGDLTRVENKSTTDGVVCCK